MPKLRDLNDIDTIVVHTSVSTHGNMMDVDGWHRERGFDKNGYHCGITNGYDDAGVYTEFKDGAIEAGRPLNEVGAHCIGLNERSIGIVVFGENGRYTLNQVAALRVVILSYMERFKKITIGRVVGHYETKNGKDQGKTCPDMDMDLIREFVRTGKLQIKV